MINATPEQNRLGFRIHAIVFVPAVVVMVIVNAFTGSPYWSLWALLGWGVGLFCHWFFVLGPGARRTEAT